MGHTALDYIITVDEFPKANNSAPMKTMKNLNGGAAANVAMIGATLGMKTGLVSAVGCEFIDSHYHKNMQKLGVDTEALIISQEESTPTAFVMTNNNQDQISYFYWGATIKIKSAISTGVLEKSSMTVKFQEIRLRNLRQFIWQQAILISIARQESLLRKRKDWYPSIQDKT